jgi:hypothetical protein
LYAVLVVAIYLFTHELNVLTDMFSWFIPGLIVGIGINLIPILYVLRGERR